MSTALSHFVAATALSVALGVAASAQTSLDASVFANAGGSSASGSLELTSTLGQVSLIGPVSSENAAILSGFVYVVFPPQVNACLFDNIPPQIGPPEVGIAKAGQDVTVAVVVTDNVGVGDVSMEYRAGGRDSLASERMTRSGSRYEGPILATARGIEYRIRAVDTCNLVAVYPASGVEVIRVDVDGEGEVASSPQPAGTEVSAYRLVSFPLELANAARSVVVDDDLGPYDNTIWRMWSLVNPVAEMPYAEQPLTIQAGLGYWLITKDGGRLDSGPGQTFATNSPFTVNLNAGWTFVGNPFAFDIPFSKLTLESGEAKDIRAYSGSWGDAATPMKPFVGYAVTNASQSTDRLFIDPVLTPAKAESRSLSDMLAALEWSVAISATAGEARDTDNLLGVSAEAAGGWDVLDRPEPPVIGDYVTVYFPHEEWDTPLKRYRTDVRAAQEEGDRWQIRVEAAVAGEVSLDFNGIEDVPPEYDVWLVDALVKSRRNLRETPSHTFMADGVRPRDLTLVIGIGDFVNKMLEAAGTVPKRLELDQNFPNPFNPSTTIRYGLSEPRKVSLVVYNLLGRRVATLIDGVQENDGYHAVVWDGRDTDGRAVASGVYVYQLKTGGRVLSRKMLLLK